jgi:hypothetical protein
MNYSITITSDDGTAEHYELPQDAAYEMMLSELANPTPGCTGVRMETITESAR